MTPLNAILAVGLARTSIFPAILSPEDPRTVWKPGPSMTMMFGTQIFFWELSRIFFSATCDLFSLGCIGWGSLSAVVALVGNPPTRLTKHVPCHPGGHWNCGGPHPMDAKMAA